MDIHLCISNGIVSLKMIIAMTDFDMGILFIFIYLLLLLLLDGDVTRSASHGVVVLGLLECLVV